VSGAASAGPPRRRVLARALGVVVLAGLAAGVLARGDIAPPRRAAQGAQGAPAAQGAPVPAAPARSVVRAPLEPPEGRTEAAPGDSAGTASREPVGAGDGRRLAPRASDGAPARAPHRDRPEPMERADRNDRPAGAARTGELAIIVRPWAMIWLNGKPRGQTPFRAAVPAGRYRVRLANEDAGRDEVTAVTVEPDRTATIERTW